MSAKPTNDNDNLPAPSCYVPESAVAVAREQAKADAETRFFKWVPLLVTAGICIASNGILISYQAGKWEQRLVPLEDHLRTNGFERLTALFVPRQEFTQRIQQRDREMQAMNEWMTRVESKLDRLLERAVKTGE